MRSSHIEVRVEGVTQGGFTSLHLKLIVSPTGRVIDVEANGDSNDLKFWPQVEPEVRQWKFIPFEMNDKAVTAEVEESVSLIPPQRFPKIHVPAPTLRPDSKVTITLERSGCYGTCPEYSVEVTTDAIVFVGQEYVAASGKHTDRVDADGVRKLAKKFIDADFYSMDEGYLASVTDLSSYMLSIEIDGQKKKVLDYVGPWVGMPAIIRDLEDDVDKLARTQRWVGGTDGLVQALQAENFNFHSFDA
jgi:hypothetical protein